MTCDGSRQFAYDDENELIGVWVSDAWSNSFAYDGKMRRRIERDYSWNGGTSGWQETNEVDFIYDGNVVVEERNGNNSPLVSYTRGTDLSGGLQGAGGIGGLLARTTYGQELPGAPPTAFYHADGNGNVTALMYPNQQLAAKYLYDPFGNMLAMSGPLMNFNKYRFSSKEWNDNAGLYYDLYRFYGPGLQRWVNRDPIGELGFEVLRMHHEDIDVPFVSVVPGLPEMPDLYEFVDNNPVQFFDSLGLDPNSPECQALLSQYNFHFTMYLIDMRYGNFGWALQEQQMCSQIMQMMSDAGCFDPPPPPPPPCPAPAPAPPLRSYNPIGPTQRCALVVAGVGLGGILEYSWVCFFAL